MLSSSKTWIVSFFGSSPDTIPVNNQKADHSSRPHSLKFSHDTPILPQTIAQAPTDIEYSGPLLDQDVVSTDINTEPQGFKDTAQAIYEFSKTLISIQKDFKNIRACFKWIDLKGSRPEHVPLTDEFTKLINIYERLVSQTREDALKLKVHGPNKFTLLVEDRVLNEFLTDSEVAGELNRFLKELPSGPWKEPLILDELESGLESFRVEFQKRVPTAQSSQSLSTVEINSTLRNDPSNSTALYAALGNLITNVKDIRPRLISLTGMLDLMKDGTQEYIAVINLPTNSVDANSPPLYYELEEKLNARGTLEWIASALKSVGPALGDLAAQIN